MKKLIKRLFRRPVVWAIRKAIQVYPKEAFTPDGKHLHSNPKRKPRPPVEFYEGEIETR